MGSYRMCVCFTRKYRVTEAEHPADVKEAFAKYADGGSHMSSDQLRRFLAEAQAGGEEADAAEKVLEAINLRHHHITGKFRKHHSLTLEDFHHYLFSADLNPPISSQFLRRRTPRFSLRYLLSHAPISAAVDGSVQVSRRGPDRVAMARIRVRRVGAGV